MKRIFFFALTAVAAMTSCSSDSDGVSDNGAGETLVPIEITFAQNSMGTRGTGTVGDTVGGDNKWHNQIVHVFMLVKDSMKIAKFSGSPIYNNEEFATPGRINQTPFSGAYEGPSTSGIARPTNDLVKYYPAQGKFSFYAYRLDDAIITSGPNLTADQDLNISFKLNGSQDIMVAKALLTATDSANLKIGETEAIKEANVKRAFSAFAARHGVQPTLTFDHKLTRLTFNVVPKSGNTVDPVGGIIVDSIKVISSTTEGKMTIAKIGIDANGAQYETGEQGIEWIANTVDSLSIMQRDTAWAYFTEPTAYTCTNIDSLNLVPLDSVDLRNRPIDKPVGIGEALLLAPENSYKVCVFMHQWTMNTYTDGLTDKKQLASYKYEDTIKLKNNRPFLEGTSYNVTINLWGLEEIVINTNLTPWDYNPNDDIEISPEENLDE